MNYPQWFESYSHYPHPINSGENRMADLIIGRELRRLRKARGATMRHMAGLAGVDESYISTIEVEGFLPRRVVAARIAEALVFLGCSRVEAHHWLLLCRYLPDGLSERVLHELAAASALSAYHQRAVAAEMRRSRKAREKARAAPPAPEAVPLDDRLREVLA